MIGTLYKVGGILMVCSLPLAHPKVRLAAHKGVNHVLHAAARAIDPEPVRTPPCSPSYGGDSQSSGFGGFAPQLEQLNPISLPDLSKPGLFLPHVPLLPPGRPIFEHHPHTPGGPDEPPGGGPGTPPDGPPVVIVTPPPVVSPGPEPASWAMMVAGFGVVGAAQRVRRGRTV